MSIIINDLFSGCSDDNVIGINVLVSLLVFVIPDTSLYDHFELIQLTIGLMKLLDVNNCFP